MQQDSLFEPAEEPAIVNDQIQCEHPDLTGVTAYRNGCRCKRCKDARREATRTSPTSRHPPTLAECEHPLLSGNTGYRYGCRCMRCSSAHRIQSKFHKDPNSQRTCIREDCTNTPTQKRRVCDVCRLSEMGPKAQCKYNGCKNPRTSNAWSRWCETHEDPKYRKSQRPAKPNYDMRTCRACNQTKRITHTKAFEICDACVRTIKGAYQSARRHNVNPEYFYQWLTNPTCKLCEHKPYLGTNRKGQATAIVVDHNHNCCPGPYSCGKCVRGFLCGTCNLKLGHLEAFTDRAPIQTILDYIAAPTTPTLTTHPGPLSKP